MADSRKWLFIGALVVVLLALTAEAALTGSSGDEPATGSTTGASGEAEVADTGKEKGGKNKKADKEESGSMTAASGGSTTGSSGSMTAASGSTETEEKDKSGSLTGASGSTETEEKDKSGSLTGGSAAADTDEPEEDAPEDSSEDAAGPASNLDDLDLVEDEEESGVSGVRLGAFGALLSVAALLV